jgi:hypothetical protein
VTRPILQRLAALAALHPWTPLGKLIGLAGIPLERMAEMTDEELIAALEKTWAPPED